MTFNATNKNRVRLSHSTLSLLESCERKFQLTKLLENDFEREETPSTVFGSAYGIGIQHYFATQNREESLFKAWLAYNPQLEDKKKTQTICLNAIEASFSYVDNLLIEYEVVVLDGKPASELSFKIDIDNNYYYVGYIDLVLRNRFTGKLIVMDIKTTGMAMLDLSPMYKNSDQLVAYSIILDEINKEVEYDIMYFVCQLNVSFSPKVHVLTYTKSLLDRLKWFITLEMAVEKLELMKELNHYPTRGNSCLAYGRPCKHFGVCTMHSADVPAEQEDENLLDYQYPFNLQELIDDHISRAA